MDKSVENSKPNKIRNRISFILDIVLLILGAVSLAVSGVLVYQRVYLSRFYVNGQSMYPTLNKDALRADGTPEGINGSDSDIGGKKIDYGVMDSHKRAINKIKRFDIIVFHPKWNPDVEYIKRVIGMPGETIMFTSSRGSDNGDLYVKQGDEFKLIEQPIANEYKAASSYSGFSKPFTLADDEYFVLGDNRDHSTDSRNSSMVGNVKKSSIVGKVVAIVGYCELRQDEDGSNEPFNVDYFSWPRFFK